MISILLKIFGVDPVEPLPKTTRRALTDVDPEPDTADPTVELSEWGGKIKRVRHVQNQDSELWEIADTSAKLKPVGLDRFDTDLIRRWNSENPDRKKLNPNSYKLAKPYVLAGWKYKDIAAALNVSESWVQRLGPRIKEAQQDRGKAAPPTG